MRESVLDWHSATNVPHWDWAVGSDAGGFGPAPIVFGAKKATMAGSDDEPCPQDPPAAGEGNGKMATTMAPATAKTARKAKMTRTIA